VFCILHTARSLTDIHIGHHHHDIHIQQQRQHHHDTVIRHRDQLGRQVVVEQNTHITTRLAGVRCLEASSICV
jgi:hypothetical protein